LPLLNDVFDTGNASTATDSKSAKNTSNNNGNGEEDVRKEQGSESSSSLAEEASISEALRMHSGYVNVNGTISRLSQLQKLISSTSLNCINCGKLQKIEHDIPKTATLLNKERIKCPSCNEKNTTTTYDYVNAITVALQDPNTFNEIERLTCFLV
jgi:hypothetical protein